MADKVIILIEDDWELLGNGLGDVAHLQYLPSMFLVNLADELGMKVTFMAEVIQQLTVREQANGNRALRLQATLWDENVCLIRERGHDVQLHLHPQWLGARYADGFFHLSKGWNIAAYPAPTRQQMLADGIAYLTDLLRPIDPDYSVHSFKAGSWGLQPSGGLLHDLEAAGIRVVMGVGRGIAHVTDEFFADYSALEEDLLPYYPDYEDIQRVADEERPLVVLPLPYYSVGARGLSRKLVERLLSRRNGGAERELFYYPNIPRHIARLSPMGPRRSGPAEILRNRGDVKSLDIGGGSFEEMKEAIDQIMDRCLRAETEILPLVLQSHTKAYGGNWRDVKRFYAYLVDRYGSHLEFQTLTEFQSLLPRLEVRSRAVAHG